jgi:uncharacterized membrane protein
MQSERLDGMTSTSGTHERGMPARREGAAAPNGAVLPDAVVLAIYARDMERALAFRHSLDMTRNVSVGIVAAMALIAFGFAGASHLVLFLGSLTVFALALIETRTFRYAEISEQRLRVIERSYFAPLLDPAVEPAPRWREELASSMAQLRPKVSAVEAFAVRIWRNYLLIFAALDACWFSKLYLYPFPAHALEEFVHRADLGFVPGWLVLSVVVPVWGTYGALVLWLHGKNSGCEPRY